MTYEEALKKRELAARRQQALIDQGHLIAKYKLSLKGSVYARDHYPESVIDDLVNADTMDAILDDMEWSLTCRICNGSVEPGHNCVTGDIDPNEYDPADVVREAEGQLKLEVTA